MGFYPKWLLLSCFILLFFRGLHFSLFRTSVDWLLALSKRYCGRWTRASRMVDNWYANLCLVCKSLFIFRTGIRVSTFVKRLEIWYYMNCVKTCVLLYVMVGFNRMLIYQQKKTPTWLSFMVVVDLFQCVVIMEARLTWERISRILSVVTCASVNIQV